MDVFHRLIPIYRYSKFITLVSKIIICVHKNHGPSTLEECRELIVGHIYSNFASLTISSYKYFRTYGFEGGMDYFIGALYKANATCNITDLHSNVKT